MLLIAFFEFCSGTFGLNMEALVFVPFLITLMVQMGYDPLVGAAIPVIGCNIGYGGAYLNPFTLGIAQGIAGLPFTSGIFVRLALMLGYLIVSSFFVIRYANVVRASPASPSKSLCMAWRVHIIPWTYKALKKTQNLRQDKRAFLSYS